MKIYTRKGDKGQTTLIGGRKVAKSDTRIFAYGTVDELNSFIGWVRDLTGDEDKRSVLLEIQDRLFTIGSLLAADSGAKMSLPKLNAADVTFLENKIDEMSGRLPEMKSFILPGGHQAVSCCHVARCVCRRAERYVVLLSENEEVDELILTYLNRLSDYLFMLSRSLSADFNATESPWKARM